MKLLIILLSTVLIIIGCRGEPQVKLKTIQTTQETKTLQTKVNKPSTKQMHSKKNMHNGMKEEKRKYH